MSGRGRSTAGVVAIALLWLLAAGTTAANAAQWQPFALPLPPGGQFETPGGMPGDLKFWAPNRGLMTVGGNGSVPEGLYSWDGVQWHQLSTVCGAGENARIAWAAPTEFWTIARPSPPRFQQAGLALCHFRDGEVVGSFSTPAGAGDDYHEMLAAACRAPDDCWFGGVGAQDGAGRRVGAFHLHWDGTSLRSVYGPQGRAVSDLLFHGGTLLESTYLGRAPNDRTSPIDLVEPESPPRLLHRLGGESFVNDPFVPAPPASGIRAPTELLGLDSDGRSAWAVGGAANSSTEAAGGVQRPPLVARLLGTGWTELALTASELTPTEVFSDVAAVPGTDQAWVTVTEANGGPGELAQPSVASIAADGTATVQRLAGSDEPLRGAARRIACPAADDCWLATARGYLYRRSDAAPYERDTDPAFQGTITVRPNEAAEQFIPDTPPEDDSRLLAPPIELPAEVPPAEPLPTCPRIATLVTKVKATARGRTRLVVRFKLARNAKIGIVGRKGKRVVARAKARQLRRGTRSVTLKVSAKRAKRPTRLSFSVSGDKLPTTPCQGSPDDESVNDDNTLTTGAAALPPR